MPAPKPHPKTRRHPRAPRIAPERRRRRPWRIVALFIILAAAALIFWPRPHGWQSLGPGTGRIRWVESRTDTRVEHPLAPAWIRSLRKSGIPWPTDLPLEPLGATFGDGVTSTTSAWYLVQSARPTQELWHLDKDSVHLSDARGNPVEWTGGTGSVLVDPHRRLQFLYVGVPAEQKGTGAVLRFRLKRFEDSRTTDEVTLPF